MNTEKMITKEFLKYMSCISNRKDSKANEMIQTALNNIDEWSIAKTNRWIGYAQCLLVAEGVTTIDKLREETRGIAARVEAKEETL